MLAIRCEIVGEKGRGWLMRWLPSRAHDNGLFLVFANGIGVDDDEIRTGNSMILDPYGRILAETTEPGPELWQTCTPNCWGRAPGDPGFRPGAPAFMLH